MGYRSAFDDVSPIGGLRSRSNLGTYTRAKALALLVGPSGWCTPCRSWLQLDFLFRSSDSSWLTPSWYLRKVGKLGVLYADYGTSSGPTSVANMMASLQNQVFFETPDLRTFQIHRMGQAFWSGPLQGKKSG